MESTSKVMMLRIEKTSFVYDVSYEVLTCTSKELGTGARHVLLLPNENCRVDINLCTFDLLLNLQKPNGVNVPATANIYN